MLYYKYNEEELDVVAALPAKEFNEYVSEHRYGTCTVCCNEYLYVDSPILKKESWKRVVNFYGLAEFEKRSERLFDRHHPPRPMFRNRKTSRKYKELTILDIKEVVPSDQHCTVCIDCMNKALDGVKKENIEDCCVMGRDYIKKHFEL